MNPNTAASSCLAEAENSPGASVPKTTAMPEAAAAGRVAEAGVGAPRLSPGSPLPAGGPADVRRPLPPALTPRPRSPAGTRPPLT